MVISLRIFGAALVAALAMNAVAVSAASAKLYKFHSSLEHTILTGVQTTENSFEFDVGTVKCKKTSFEGTLAVKTTTTVTVSPAYSECTFGGAAATVTVNNCDYLLHAVTKEGSNYEGSLDIVCPAGSVMQFDVPNCTITVFPQTGRKKVTYTKEGSAPLRRVIVHFSVSEIEYEEHGTACEHPTVLTKNGTYNGSVTISGETTEKKEGDFWVEEVEGE